jgi:hypothetical protein
MLEFELQAQDRKLKVIRGQEMVAAVSVDEKALRKCTGRASGTEP